MVKGSLRPKTAIGDLNLSAITRRSGFFSIAAIHFHAHSEAVIDLRGLRFAAWSAGMQRQRTHVYRINSASAY